MLFTRMPVADKCETPQTSIERRDRRFASVLLDQQLWCIGCDIRHPDGNLLVRYGFERVPAPDSAKDCTTYILRPQSESEFVLWGFGIFHGELGYGGIFLKRYTFTPKWTSADRLPEAVWSTARLPAMQWPKGELQHARTNYVLQRTVSWLADYEDWILQNAGIEHRQECLRRWPKRIVEAERVPQEWRRIATVIEDCHA